MHPGYKGISTMSTDCHLQDRFREAIAGGAWSLINIFSINSTLLLNTPSFPI
jgi:hypothetical protein